MEKARHCLAKLALKEISLGESAESEMEKILVEYISSVQEKKIDSEHFELLFKSKIGSTAPLSFINGIANIAEKKNYSTTSPLKKDNINKGKDDSKMANYTTNVKDMDLAFSPVNDTHYNKTVYAKKYMTKSHPRTWSKAEDQRLLAGILKFGLENWGYVSLLVGNRTKGQCSQRWSRGLSPNISNTPWSEEDDQSLLQLVQKYNDHSWSKISEEIKNRSDAQCRYRYATLKKRMKQSGQFISLNNNIINKNNENEKPDVSNMGKNDSTNNKEKLNFEQNLKGEDFDDIFDEKFKENSDFWKIYSDKYVW